MRFFHSLAGVGTSFGFPQVTALAKEGELECLALIHDKAAPTTTEIENWTSLIGGLAHELSHHPASSTTSAAPAPAPPAAAAAGARLPEILLVSSDADVAGTMAPLLSQEGLSPRTITTREGAAEALGKSLPDALIVDAVLGDGSGYDVIDRLRGLAGGEGVAVLVLGPSGAFLDKVEAIHGGADGYFEKPVDWKALMRRLQHLLEASDTHAARILSVEDDPEQAAYLKAILESGGYEVARLRGPQGLRDRPAQLPARPRAHGHPAPGHQRLRPRPLPAPGREARHPARPLPHHREPDAVALPQRAGRGRRSPVQAGGAARAPLRGGLPPGEGTVPEEPPEPRRPDPPLHPHRAHGPGAGPARAEGARPGAGASRG